MQLLEILKSSLITLKTNGRRTFLTMIGIIIGIAAVITIMSLGNGFKKQTLDNLVKDEQGRPSQTFNFEITNFEKDFDKIQPFKESDFELIRGVDGVDDVKVESHEKEFTPYASVTLRNQSYHYPTQRVEQTKETMIVGRNLTPTDSQNKKRYIIIDDGLAMEVFQTVEGALNRVLTYDDNDFTVIGVYQGSPVHEQGFTFDYTPEAPRMYIPQGTYDLLNTNKPQPFEVRVFYKIGTDVKTANKQVAQILKDKGSARQDGNYAYFDTSEMMKEFGKQLNMITYFISSVAGISLFIAGVGVMNMMYISVSERTKEIGIRRSLGATQKSIQLQFLLEGIAITTLGGMIGYVTGMGIASLIGNFLPFRPSFDIPTALLSVFVSVFIGIVFSVFPAKAASRKNVVEILR